MRQCSNKGKRQTPLALSHQHRSIADKQRHNQPYHHLLVLQQTLNRSQTIENFFLSIEFHRCYLPLFFHNEHQMKKENIGLPINSEPANALRHFSLKKLIKSSGLKVERRTMFEGQCVDRLTIARDTVSIQINNESKSNSESHLISDNLRPPTTNHGKVTSATPPKICQLDKMVKRRVARCHLRESLDKSQCNTHTNQLNNPVPISDFLAVRQRLGVPLKLWVSTQVAASPDDTV